MLCASFGTISGTAWAAWAASTHNWPFCSDLIGSYLWVAYPTVENLTLASELIVIGSVEEVGPSFESQNTLFTRIVLNASQTLKNIQSSSLLEFRTIGGKVGCYTSVTNDASFAKGDKVLLFLDLITSSDTYLRVLGGPQGEYQITNGTAYNFRHEPVPLNDLISEIRTYV